MLPVVGCSPSPELRSCPRSSLQQHQLKCGERAHHSGSPSGSQNSTWGDCSFSITACVFLHILRHALRERFGPLLTAVSSLLWCSTQITPSTRTRLHPERKSLFREWDQAGLTVSFYIGILKESFLCSWDCSSGRSEGYNLLSSSRAVDAAQPYTHGLTVFTVLSSTIF